LEFLHRRFSWKHAKEKTERLWPALEIIGRQKARLFAGPVD
jgi:hypothetical protein